MSRKSRFSRPPRPTPPHVADTAKIDLPKRPGPLHRRTLWPCCCYGSWCCQSWPKAARSKTPSFLCRARASRWTRMARRCARSLRKESRAHPAPRRCRRRHFPPPGLAAAAAQVHAHGGQLLQEGSTFYWVGTSQKVLPAWTSTHINIYSSTDLQNWQFRCGPRLVCQLLGKEGGGEVGMHHLCCISRHPPAWHVQERYLPVAANCGLPAAPALRPPVAAAAAIPHRAAQGAVPALCRVCRHLSESYSTAAAAAHRRQSWRPRGHTHAAIGLSPPPASACPTPPRPCMHADPAPRAAPPLHPHVPSGHPWLRGARCGGRHQPQHHGCGGAALLAACDVDSGEGAGMRRASTLSGHARQPCAPLPSTCRRLLPLPHACAPTLQAPTAGCTTSSQTTTPATT